MDNKEETIDIGPHDTACPIYGIDVARNAIGMCFLKMYDNYTALLKDMQTFYPGSDWLGHDDYAGDFFGLAEIQTTLASLEWQIRQHRDWFQEDLKDWEGHYGLDCECNARHKISDLKEDNKDGLEELINKLQI